MSSASFLWMAELNAEVRCRIGWLGGGWRKVDGGRGRGSGQTSIAVVNGVVQVASVGVGRAADRTVLSHALRGSGAGSGRLLAGSLDFGVDVEVDCGVHVYRLGW